MRFNARIKWDKSEGGKSINEEKVVFLFDTPKEFGGKAKHSSPEEIFISSIGACLITTFLFFRKKMPFSMKSLKVDMNGKLGKIINKGYRFTKINALLVVQSNNSQNIDKIQKCFQLTKKFCPLSQTLKNCIPMEISLIIDEL